MGYYEHHVLPHLVHLSMRQDRLLVYRHRVVSGAQGRVLEIGVGSGLNFPLFSNAVERVIGIDTSPELLSRARQVDRRDDLSIELIEGSAEALPLQDTSVDTVVTTWTLCTIPDAHRALREMRRVLRPSGALLFVEHGRSPDAPVKRWQDRLTPAWKRLSGGCHLNRSIPQLLEDSGFGIERLETGYMKGPRPMTFMYEGTARPVRPGEAA
jgi:ubiquinone/menaquinone biosynthesis C-methylase UbiE